VSIKQCNDNFANFYKNPNRENKKTFSSFAKGIKECAMKTHLSFKSLRQRTTCLDIGALKDALMLTVIEFLSPWMFSSTHSTSLSSCEAKHSVVSWFHEKPEAH